MPRITIKNYYKLYQAGQISRLQWLQWKCKSVCHNNPKMEELRDLILSCGGDAVLLPAIEDDLDKLLKRGLIYDPADFEVKLMLGEPCQCHGNSANLWEANQVDFPGRLLIVTGYGLTRDSDGIELWRQHTWCFDTLEAEIIETTEPRKLYFGAELTKAESERFAWENY